MSRPIHILELRSVRGTGGGPEKTILNGARLADPARFAVTVCYIRDRRDDRFGVSERAEGGDIDYVEVMERHSFDPSIWPKLRRLIAGRAIDIVHSHDYKTNLIAWLLARSSRVPILSTVHGWTGHSTRERVLYYPGDKWLLARFPRVVAVSTDIKNELVRHGAREDRVTTVLNGIDDRQFRRDRARTREIRASLGLSSGDIVIGAVGRLERQKRFDLLLEAFTELRRARPALKLIIAGDGSLREDLAAHRDRLGLGDSCMFPGLVADVARLHHAFDLFVQSSDYEGTPNAVLEAMALETPTVATDVGGTRELLRDRVEGLIVPSGDAHELARAMERLLGNPAEASAMAAAARVRVERELSFAIRMQRVESIYEELVPPYQADPTRASACV